MKAEFEEISKGCDSDVLINLIDNAPIGMILLNEQTEVIYANEAMASYFEYSPEGDHQQFGNLFNCQIVSNAEEDCGTKRQCTNCKIRNNIKNAIRYRRAIKDIKVHKAFINNGITHNKWLDISIVPIVRTDEIQLILFINDITESAKYHIDFEMDQLMLYEDNNKEKTQFHEGVLNEISENCKGDGQAYLMLIELNHYQPIKDTFGAIWADDYCMDFMNYFYTLIESKDYACRYSENQIMTFIPCSRFEVQHYHDQIGAFNYKHFRIKSDIKIKTLRLTAKKSNKDHLNDEEIYLSYFRSISRLEKANDYEVIEWEL
ncbi:MAG: hypothetical protein BGO41_10395 [Clostridiales bacterium 38-18]|nr:MAG: hypothetical protein BGO41_10395 [Clostridiales bacterium 38-18]